MDIMDILENHMYGYLDYDMYIIDNEFDISSIGKDIELYSLFDNKGYWISKDGTKRYPNQFEYKHLVNTIRMIEKKATKYNVDPQSFKIYNLLKLELKLRDASMEHI